jgi:glycosyltransferase involved in cell wall biosynthesis
MKVILTSGSLLPRYGGPAYSVARLATALIDKGIRVGVWAPDGSAGSNQILASCPEVLRLDVNLADIWERFSGADLIHDSGIWLPHNHRLARLAKAKMVPRVVSLRGMLEPLALRHKRMKKAVAWIAYQRHDLLSAGLFHATSEREAINIRRLNLGVPIRTIPNGVDAAASLIAERSKARLVIREEKRVALFLGRLHPIKGLPMLIEAWARVKPANWELRIVGPDEARHRAELEQQVARAGLSEAVIFVGDLHGEEKERAIIEANLFVLPSLSESFGVVVAEALAHGVPVLTTSGTPWSMLETEGCGWSVAPTVQGLVAGIGRATALESEALKQMGAHGVRFVLRDFSWSRVAQEFVAAYEGLLQRP